MSLFSGFSTAIDEERALRLSRKVTQEAFRVLATIVRLHKPGPEQLVDPHINNGQPTRLCTECGKPHPCPTWNTAVDYTRNAP